MADAPTILGPEDMAKLGRYRFAVRLMVEGWLSGRHRAKGRGSGSDRISSIPDCIGIYSVRAERSALVLYRIGFVVRCRMRVIHSLGLNHKDQVVGYGIVDGLITRFCFGICSQRGRYGLGYGREIVFEKNLLVVGIKLVRVGRGIVRKYLPLGTRLIFIAILSRLYDYVVNSLYGHFVRIGAVALDIEVIQRAFIAEISQMDRIAYVSRITVLVGRVGRVGRVSGLRICAAYDDKCAVLRRIGPFLVLGT